MIQAFYHVATINHWRDIYDEQIAAFESAGLHEICRLSISKVGEQRISIPAYATLVSDLPDLQSYEFPTLDILQRSANGPTLYFHTKGASHGQPQWETREQFWKSVGIPDQATLRKNEDQWRKYMTYYVIRQYERCLSSLESNDACGVSWMGDHFGGNFWWANADYLKELQRPSDLKKEADALGMERASAEKWIGSGSPRVECFKHTKHNLYRWGMPYLWYGRHYG